MSPDWDLLKATQKSLREHMRMCRKKDAAYSKLKVHLETCQDRYDHDMAEAEKEIADLKRGFIEVDEAFKILSETFITTLQSP